jgi:hypothetical protein
MKKSGSGALSFAAVFVVCVLPARASVLFSAGSGTVLPGSVGNSIEVDITNTGTSGVQLGGFVFEITTTNPDVTFTDATDATATSSYIFTGNSLFGPDIALSGSGQTFDAADNAATPSSFTTLDPGETLGLGLVFFDVSPSAGTETVIMSFNLSDSSLADGSGNTVSIDGSQAGTITVATPEPSEAFGLLAAFGVLALRKRKARIRDIG